MEEYNTNTMADKGQLVISEITKVSFQDFIDKLNEAFPTTGGFDTENISLVPRGKSAEVYIPLKNQSLIEDLVEDFANRLKLNILYAISAEEGKNIKVIGYSMPYQYELYVVAIETMQYGIVEGIHVAFYDSMDDMFEEVRHYYLAGRYMLEEPGTEELEAESYQQFFSHFI